MAGVVILMHYYRIFATRDSVSTVVAELPSLEQAQQLLALVSAGAVPNHLSVVEVSPDGAESPLAITASGRIEKPASEMEKAVAWLLEA